MRLITSEEVAQVSGGKTYLEEVAEAMAKFYQGLSSSGSSCQNYTATNGNTMTVQTCGLNSSTVTTTSPGFYSSTTVYGGYSVSGSAGFRGASGQLQGNTPSQVIVNTCLNGKCTVTKI
jgi:hypothetical protein